MATITAQSEGGVVTPTYTAVSASDQFAADPGGLLLIIKNGGASPDTVTITDAGSTPAGNLGTGLFVDEPATVGGTATGAGNVISANTASGIDVQFDVSGAVIEGNLIGTTADGTGALGNGFDGILIGDSSANPQPSGNTIGSVGTDAGNVIAHIALKNS